MAIVNPPFSPPARTLALRQATKVQRIKTNNTRLLNSIVTLVTANLAEVWADEDQTNFSPQQVFALFGTDAGALVTASASLAAVVNAAVPGSLPTAAPAPLTVNADGTVTVGAVVVPPQS